MAFRTVSKIYAAGIPAGIIFTAASNYLYSDKNGKPEFSLKDEKTKPFGIAVLAVKSYYHGLTWPLIPYYLYKDYKQFMTVGATCTLKINEYSYSKTIELTKE